jgi:hypothetical protein
VVKNGGKRPRGRPECRLDDDIGKESAEQGGDWINLAKIETRRELL